jgi:hypothetical protein
MKLVLESTNIEVYCGDSRELIHEIEGYDLVFTGPPYGSNQPYGVGIDNWKPDRDFWKVLFDKSAPNAKMVCQVNTSHLAWWIDEIRAAGWKYAHCGVYINPDRESRDYMNFPYVWEPILFFYKGNDFIINKARAMQRSDVFTISAPENSMYRCTDHPCHADYHTWLRVMSMIDFTVMFDPFAGIGTSMIAAKALGKKCIGIEQNPKFCYWILNNLGQV